MLTDYDVEILAKTMYGEARGEGERGLIAVAWVVRTRARANRSYWGGSSVADVCRYPKQFECWKGKTDIDTSQEPDIYERCLVLARAVLAGDRQYPDPTRGADHFNNPDKEDPPEWLPNVTKTVKIGDHQFYRSK